MWKTWISNLRTHTTRVGNALPGKAALGRISSGTAALTVLRFFGSIFTGLVMLTLGALAVVYYGGDPVIRQLAQSQGSAVLNRQVKLGEQFHVGWGWPTRIIANDVHIANASWGTGPDMFAAGKVEIDLDPDPLFHRQLRFAHIVLDDAKILIETSKTGEGNWSMTQGAAAPKDRTQFPDIQDIELRNTSFTWHNGETSATTLVTFSEGSVKTPDITSPIAIAMAGTFQHEAYHLTAQIGPLSQLQDATQPYPLRLDGELAHTRLGIDGTIKEPVAFSGVDVKLLVEGQNLQNFLKVFSIPVPETPPYRLAGRLTHDGQHWAIAGMDGRLGASRLTGNILIDPSGKVPYIKADLVSPLMDLTDFKGFYGGTPEHTGATPEARATTAADRRTAARKTAETADPYGRVIPDTPIPLKQLTTFNTDLTFDGREIKRTEGIPFQRVRLSMSLKDGTLDLKPLDFELAGGAVSARMILHSTEHPARFHGDFQVRHIDLSKLFRSTPTMKQVKETSGLFSGYIRFDSSGQSPRALLAGMNGDFGFFMEGGQFSELLIYLFGLDVFHSVLVYAEGDKPIPIDCVATRFQARAGVATATTFLIDTTKSTITGQGNLDFKDETLNMRFVPQPKQFSPLTLRSPIDVTGALGKPSVRPETKSLLAQIGAAIGLGVVAGPAAEIPLADMAGGVKGACAQAFSAPHPAAETRAAEGSSTPPAAPRATAPRRR